MLTKPRVYLIDAVESPLSTEVDVERAIFKDEADLIFTQTADSDDFPDEVFTADALIVSHFPRILDRHLPRFKNLQMIVRNGVGFDNIDADAAQRLGIPVCNVPDYGTEEVADYAILLTLALQRNFYAALSDVRKGNWTWHIAEPGRRLRGQKFGIIGCGRIGTATALRAKALQFDVQFFDPYIPAGHEKAIGVSRCSSLQQLLQTSDVVSLHCPLNSSTRGMIGEAEVRSMKKGAFVVNTGRGPLIRESALIDALKNAHLAGVALDVLENEPLCSPELFAFPNCLVSPHIAFYSDDSVKEMRESAARNVLRCLQGFGPSNVVNQVPVVTRVVATRQ